MALALPCSFSDGAARRRAVRRAVVDGNGALVVHDHDGRAIPRRRAANPRSVVAPTNRASCRFLPHNLLLLGSSHPPCLHPILNRHTVRHGGSDDPKSLLSKP